ncbi:hypothetical protein Tco_0796578 [Tanacetum coccineum]
MFTQNRSPCITSDIRNPPYHIINARKPQSVLSPSLVSLLQSYREVKTSDKKKKKVAVIFDGFLLSQRFTGPQNQEKVPQIAETVTTSNEMEFLNSWMFSELLNGTSLVVSKSSAVHAADNPDKRQQYNTTHTSTTTDVADPPPLNIHSTHQTPTQVPTVTAPEKKYKSSTNSSTNCYCP